MSVLLLFLAGFVACAILERRGGRAAWLTATAVAALGWFLGLLQGRGLPRTWPVGQWRLPVGDGLRLQFTMADVEWRLIVFLAALMLILHLVEPARADPPDPSLPKWRFLYAGTALCSVAAGTALTMALLLPFLDVLTRWILQSRDGSAGGGTTDAWGLRLDAAGVALLAAGVAAAGPSGWPAPGWLLSVFALRIAGAYAMWRRRPLAPGSSRQVLALTVPAALGLKLMAEVVRGNGMEPLPEWMGLVAALAGVYVLLRSTVEPIHLGGSPVVLAMAALALAAATREGAVSLATLGWLGAVTLLSAGGVFLLGIYGLEDRLWGAGALSVLLFAPAVAVPSSTTSNVSSASLLALLSSAAALWIILIRRLAGPAQGAAGPDMPSRMLARLGLALPSVVGIGVGMRDAGAASSVGLAVSAVSLAIGAVIAWRGRRGAPGRRTRWARAVEWIDLDAAAGLMLRVSSLVGRGLRGLAWLFESGGGVLWAWALLLVAVLLAGGQS